MNRSMRGEGEGADLVAELRRLQGCCGDCGRKYGDEYGFPDLVVSKSVWLAISATGDEGGLLCPSCMCRRAHEAGLSGVSAVFRSGPFAVYEERARPTAPTAPEAPEAPTREEAGRMVAWLFDSARNEIGLSHKAGDAAERFRLRSGGMALLEAAVLIEERLVEGREPEPAGPEA